MKILPFLLYQPIYPSLYLKDLSPQKLHQMLPFLLPLLLRRIQTVESLLVFKVREVEEEDIREALEAIEATDIKISKMS